MCFQIRYAYSDEVGEEGDEEEARSLTKGTSEGDFNLVKQVKNEKIVGSTDSFSLEDGQEEDKREWSTVNKWRITGSENTKTGFGPDIL